MITQYLSFKKMGVTFLLTALLLLLVIGSGLSAQILLINDGFERPTTFELWDDNGITNWSTSPSIFYSGTRSARAANNSEGFLTSDDLDTSDALSIDVDFWFRKSNTSDTGFTLYYYDGSTYDLIAELDGLGADDTWLHYTQTITDTRYLISDFRVRFDATLGGSEFAYIDDIMIMKDTGETLTVNLSGSGSGVVTSNPPGINCGSDCTEAYFHNTVVTLAAVPDPGSLFTGWSGAGCSGTGTCVVTMDAARSVTANFSPGALLTISLDGTGTGTVTSSPAGINCGSDCTETYPYDTVVTLTAIPAPGSIFTGWTGAGCSGTGTCVITMDAARSITATFAPSYTLSVSRNGTGAGTVSSDPAGIDCGLDCNQDYEYATEVTLSAVADPGSTFTGWSGAGCSGTGECVVTMDAAASVTAEFTLNTYTLSVSAAGSGSGMVSSDPAGIDCGLDCTEDYDYNIEVTLSAVADPGSTFTGWSGTGCAGIGDCVVTMDAAVSVTAEFTLNTYTLSVSATGSGSGMVSSSPAGIDCGLDCSEDYDYNTEVTLNAVADADSTFTGWSGAGCSGTGACVVTMDAAASVTAEFTLSTYTLSVSGTGSGSGMVSSDPAGIDCGLDCTEDYDYNTEVTLSAVADLGSTFTGWSGAGCSGTGDCVVTMDAAASVTAEFTLNTYTLSVSSTGSGSGTVGSDPAGIDCGVDCTEDYDYNTEVTLSAVADTGSTFTGWSGAGCSGTGDCVVTMDAAALVTAEFAQSTYVIYLPLVQK